MLGVDQLEEVEVVDDFGFFSTAGVGGLEFAFLFGFGGGGRGV